jgi:hypothetical protein
MVPFTVISALAPIVSVPSTFKVPVIIEVVLAALVSVKTLLAPIFSEAELATAELDPPSIVRFTLVLSVRLPPEISRSVAAALLLIEMVTPDAACRVTSAVPFTFKEFNVMVGTVVTVILEAGEKITSSFVAGAIPPLQLSPSVQTVLTAPVQVLVKAKELTGTKLAPSNRT